MAKLKYTSAQVKRALLKNLGLLTHTAKTLNCCLSTVENYLDRYPKLKVTRREASEKYNDDTELAMHKGIVEDRKPELIKYRLNTMAKDRGYGADKLELTGANGEAINVNVNILHKQEDKEST